MPSAASNQIHLYIHTYMYIYISVYSRVNTHVRSHWGKHFQCAFSQGKHNSEEVRAAFHHSNGGEQFYFL